MKGGDPQPGSGLVPVRSRGAFGMASTPDRAGPRRVGPSRLRSEMPARLGLDRQLPGQQAASVRSARAAGARRPLSGTSRHGDPGLISASPISAHPPRLDLPRPTDRPALLAQQARRCGVGDAARPCRCPHLPIGHAHIPPTNQRTLLTAHTQPFLRPQQNSETQLLIGCLQPDEPVSFGSLVRIRNSCF